MTFRPISLRHRLSNICGHRKVELLRHDNVVSAEAIAEHRALPDFGITPTSYESIVPTYLYRFRKTGQFADQHAA